MGRVPPEPTAVRLEDAVNGEVETEVYVTLELQEKINWEDQF